MTYPKWKQDRCVGCAEGLPMSWDYSDGPKHYRFELGQPLADLAGFRIACTSPTEEEYIAELESELAQAKKDTVRLDWVDSHGYATGGVTIRDTIDAYMAEEPAKEPPC